VVTARNALNDVFDAMEDAMALGDGTRVVRSAVRAVVYGAVDDVVDDVVDDAVEDLVWSW
jgi:hypothetical protein